MLAYVSWSCLLVIIFLEALSYEGDLTHRTARVNRLEAFTFVVPPVATAALAIHLYWCVQFDRDGVGGFGRGAPPLGLECTRPWAGWSLVVWPWMAWCQGWPPLAGM